MNTRGLRFPSTNGKCRVAEDARDEGLIMFTLDQAERPAESLKKNATRVLPAGPLTRAACPAFPNCDFNQRLVFKMRS